MPWERVYSLDRVVGGGVSSNVFGPSSFVVAMLVALMSVAILCRVVESVDSAWLLVLFGRDTGRVGVVVGPLVEELWKVGPSVSADLYGTAFWWRTVLLRFASWEAR